MLDRVVSMFLQRQRDDAMALTRESDLVTIFLVSPQHFAVQLRCKGLVQIRTGEIATAAHFEFGVYLPSDYLRHANAFEVVTWFGPGEIWHPNISNKAPFICIGHLTPGTPLVDIIHRVFQIVAYQKVTMREDDALNREACAWARQNQHRFPIDGRPLKRRSISLEIEDSGKGQEQ